MKHNDPEIKEFFDQLRETDAKEVDIPRFDLPAKKQKQSIVRYLLPIAVAASLLLFFAIDWGAQTADLEENTLVVTMTIEEHMNTDEFISEETSMSSWKSPSDILIQEFED